jgi:hypothetical protein
LNKEKVGIISVVVIMIMIIAIIIYGPWKGGIDPYYNPQESLPHIASPSDAPGEYVNATVVGNLSMSVTGSFYTMVPHNFPATFDFTIQVSVNNTRHTSIDDFQVVKVTMFYEDATPVYTFGVVPDSAFTIAADSIWVQEFQNDRDMVSIPSEFLWAPQTFARALVSFDNGTEAILTTPLTSFGHAIE